MSKEGSAAFYDLFRVYDHDNECEVLIEVEGGTLGVGYFAYAMDEEGVVLLEANFSEQPSREDVCVVFGFEC
jgi:hypothetical protein